MTNFSDRICDKCGVGYTPTGSRQRLCSKCGSPYHAEWRKNHREDSRRKQRERYEGCSEAWVKRRVYNIKRSLGLWADPKDIPKLVELWEERPTNCELCGRPEAENQQNRALNMDHCHATNTFRGFLCGQCNNGIARFSDNPELMRKAAEYVKRGGYYA